MEGPGVQATAPGQHRQSDVIEIAKLGVIGAGQMGSGIAQVCALAGIDVLLNDVSEAKTHAGVDAIRTSFGKLVER